MLTIINTLEAQNGHTAYLVRCSCGKELTICSQYLTTLKHCGEGSHQQILGLTEMSRRLGIPRTTLRNRIVVHGSIEPTGEVNQYKPIRISYDNKVLGYTGWAKIVGISAKLLRDRITRGWSIEKALTTTVRGQTN